MTVKKQTFKSVAAVIRFFKIKGYEVEKSKVYQDKRKGLLRSDENGTISEDEALAYVVRSELGKVGDAVAEIDQYAGVRSKKEIEKLEVQTEKLRFELDKERGKYILKEDIRLQVAMKLGALEAGIKNTVRVNAAGKIPDMADKVVGGVVSGLDNLFFTDEEKSDASAAAMAAIIDFIKSTASESSARSVTRRILAVMILSAFLILLLTAAGAYPFNAEWSKFLIECAGSLSGLVLAVGVFYFGPYQIGQVIKRFKTSKDGS